MPPILQADTLTYTYGQGTPFERRALDQVSFSLEKGEFAGIIGHTGSGKSTLLQHLNGLLRPQQGVVRFQGEDIADKKELRRLRFHVGLVFQYPEYQLFEETVARDIAFGPKNMGLDEREVADRVNDAMAFVGLPGDLAMTSPFHLSGGQKRRVAIAGVIAMRPDVLILDEPTAGLDPEGRTEILNQIYDYHKQTGCTVLLVTHSMDEAARLAQTIHVMADAKIAFSGTPGTVFTRADELSRMGLSVPGVTRVALRLRAMGLDIDASVHTLEQTRDEILRLWKGAGHA